MTGRPDLPETLPHPVVDNHCHLDIARGHDEPALPVAEALDLAASVGIGLDDVQVRTRTVGPEHELIEELVVVASR